MAQENSKKLAEFGLGLKTALYDVPEDESGHELGGGGGGG